MHFMRRGENTEILIAGLADMHISADATPHQIAQRNYEKLVAEMAEVADAIVIAGDITNRGTLEEAQIAAQIFGQVHKPVLAVLGNHEYENNLQEEIATTLKQAGVILLNEKPFYLQKGERRVGFAGVKGFEGGFGKQHIRRLGEPDHKAFYDAATPELERLDTLLKNLDTDTNVVVLHYSPIKTTIANHSPEVHPFMGDSRLEEVIDRHADKVVAILHGHGHKGPLEGATTKDIPVHNVAYPLRRKMSAQSPYALIKI